jgi:hypothetical protein
MKQMYTGSAEHKTAMIKSACLAEGESMSSAGERSRYLSVALDARRAINAIRSIERSSGDLGELRSSISAAAVSLKAVSSGGDLYAQLGPNEHTPYRQFEEIQTVIETSSTFEQHDLMLRLEQLLTSDEPAEEDLQLARRFFHALENRALHHFNDPMPSEGTTF